MLGSWLPLGPLECVNASRALAQRKEFEAKQWPPLTEAAIEHFRGVLRALRPYAGDSDSLSVAELEELVVQLFGLTAYAEGAATGAK